MSTARPLTPSLAAGTASSGGRHRAERTPGRARRAALATVAAGLPLVPAVVMAGPAHAETDWDKLAQCESGGDWGINTGNGFSGGLQFTPSTWKAFGGSGDAQDASRSEQIQVAEKVKAAQGMTAWPTCSKKTGQTDSSPNSGASSDESSSGSSTGSSKKESSSKEGSSKKESSDDSAAPAKKSEAPARKAPAKKASTRKASTPAVEKVADTTSAGTYTVKAGDTLSTIASSQGVAGGWAALRDANTSLVTDPNMIFPGQALALS